MTHTTDGGKTWNVQLDSLLGEPFGLSDISFADRKNGLAVGTGAKIVRTTDGGTTWFYENSGLAPKRVESTFASIAYPNHTRAFAVTTFGGIYRYMGQPPLSSVPLPPLSTVSPLHVEVFPNLLIEPTAKLRIWTPRKTIANIELLTTLRECAQRWETVLWEAGHQQLQLNIASLPLGEYFLRIVSNEGSLTLPIIIR